TAYEHAHAPPAQLVGGQVRVFERLPGQLHGQPLLRIHVLDLARRHGEELRVETRDVVEVPAAGVRGVDGGRHRRIAPVLVPTALRQVPDAVAPVREHPPHFAGGRPRSGETGGDADDRDIVRPRLP